MGGGGGGGGRESYCQTIIGKTWNRHGSKETTIIRRRIYSNVLWTPRRLFLCFGTSIGFRWNLIEAALQLKILYLIVCEVELNTQIKNTKKFLFSLSRNRHFFYVKNFKRKKSQIITFEQNRKLPCYQSCLESHQSSFRNHKSLSSIVNNFCEKAFFFFLEELSLAEYIFYGRSEQIKNAVTIELGLFRLYPSGFLHPLFRSFVEMSYRTSDTCVLPVRYHTSCYVSSAVTINRSSRYGNILRFSAVIAFESFKQFESSSPSHP